jgi:hypothetical protein
MPSPRRRRQNLGVRSPTYGLSYEEGHQRTRLRACEARVQARSPSFLLLDYIFGLLCNFFCYEGAGIGRGKKEYYR